MVWYIAHILLLFECIYINIVPTIQVESCNEYNNILPNGFCTEYLQNKKINGTKEEAMKKNTKLVAFYEQYLPLYIQSIEEVRRIVKFTIAAKCGTQQEITNIIDSFSMPSGSEVKQCADELKKLACEASHPICIKTDGVINIALPCQERCIQASKTTSCSFLKSLQAVERQIKNICPAWSIKLTFDCSHYPVSNTINKEYCPIHKSSTYLNGNLQVRNPKSEENRIVDMPDNHVPIFEDNIRSEFENVNIEETVTCVEYNKVLPDGICISYMKNKRIAQTKEYAVRRNNFLVNIYETYIPLYSSYQSNKKQLKSLLKFYASTACSSNKDKVNTIIDSITIPSGLQVKQCSEDIKKLVCETYHPICTSDTSNKIVVSIPCRDNCEKTWNTSSCDFVKPLHKLLQPALELCRAWVSRMHEYTKTGYCKHFPVSNKEGQEYCPVSEPNNFSSFYKNIVSVEDNINSISKTRVSMDSIEMKNYEETTKSDRAESSITPSVEHEIDSVFSEEINSRNTHTCIEYGKTLPKGICIKYLKHKRIAQNKRMIVSQNTKLVYYYKESIRHYTWYQQNPSAWRHYAYRMIQPCRKKHTVTVKDIINSIDFPSGAQLKACSGDIKELVCETYHPVCLNDATKGVPCRGKCKKVFNATSCSFLKPLLKKLRKLGRLCRHFGQITNKIDCSHFPASKVKGDEYCPLRKLNALFDWTWRIDSVRQEEEKSNDISNYLTNMNQVEINKYNGDTNECVSYISVIPAGVCDKYLSNANVAQSTERLKTMDNNIGRIYMLFDTLLLNSQASEFSTTAYDIWSWFSEKILLTCHNNTKIYDLKRMLIQIPKMSKIRDCLHGNGWFYCHVYHPKCASSHGSSKTSPVCRESCEGIWNSPSCSFVKTFYKLYKHIKEVCTIPYDEHIDNLFNCEKYPPLDMKHIENCQLRNITDTPPTTSCYHGNGFNYNGTEDTAGGHRCVEWRSDPYLNTDVYPSLIKNYCRNPQGYAEKPWCYTNMKTKTWALCNVQKCDNPLAETRTQISEITESKYNSLDTGQPSTKHEKSTPLSELIIRDNSLDDRHDKTYVQAVNVIVIVAVAIVTVVIGCIVFIYYNKKKERIIKEYRGIPNKPDINYVRVEHDDMN